MGVPFVRVLSAIERHNAYQDDPIQYRGGWAVDRDDFWSMAGVGPDDVDFLQTYDIKYASIYDSFTITVLIQIEDLGFCAKGEAPAFVRAHRMTTDGDFPHNTSGGQLSVGQAGAGGGYLGLVEAVRQLTDEAGGTSVPDARVGLVSGFGMINYDRGLASSAVLLARA